MSVYCCSCVDGGQSFCVVSPCGCVVSLDRSLFPAPHKNLVCRQTCHSCCCSGGISCNRRGSPQTALQQAIKGREAGRLEKLGPVDVGRGKEVAWIFV